MKSKAMLLLCSFLLLLPAAYTYAQVEPEDKLEQRETKIQEAVEALKRPPETAKDIIEMLKERALLRIKERRRELLLKTKLSAGIAWGFETNVTQASDTKGDYYREDNFSLYWQPTFNRYFGLDTGYWLVNQAYTEQTDSSSLDHAVNFTVNLTPFENGRLKLSPGIEYEWLWYPFSSESTYDNLKYFLKLKHYIGKKWNYGGGYEYSEKVYDEKKARDANKTATALSREDTRHTVDLYLTRYLGKFTFKVKGKFYVNYSNDQYREYYDLYSLKPSISIARTFLKDDKLYVSFNPSFERKNYMHRTAVDTARYDDVTTWQVSAYYSLKKPFTLSYKFTFKEVETNVDIGRYKNITNVIGLNIDF